MKFTSIATTLVALCWGASQANAQEATVQGTGYEVGQRAVIHPTIGAETGFISNVFYEEGGVESSPLLNIKATVAIETKEESAGKTDFEFLVGLRAIYQEYLNGNNNITTQRNLGLGADVQLGLIPQSTFPITVEDHFIRTTRPTNFESANSLPRDINTFKVRAAFKPKSSTISVNTHFQNTIDVFESDGSKFANRMLNELGLGVDWQFLPITKFFIRGGYGFNSSFSSGTRANSNPIHGIVGIASAITENITTRAHIGYGHSPYDNDGAGYSNILWNLEGGYRYSPLGRLRLILNREFKDSINSNFYGQYAGRIIVNQQIERIMLSADIAARLRSYGGVDTMLGGGDTRDDFILSAGVNASYAIKEWLEINASYSFTNVSTDYRTTFEGAGDDPGYVRHQAMVGVTAAF